MRNLYPLGQLTDEGDTFLQVRRLVKGKRFGLIWKLGPVRDTVPADRVAGTTTPTPAEGVPDVMADLHADKKVTLSIEAVDEIGNPTAFDPTAWTVAYAVDDPAIINLTDAGDGTAEAAAVGALGNALVTATLTRVSDGSIATGVLAIQVIAGDAGSFVVVAGAESEVTPDA